MVAHGLIKRPGRHATPGSPTNRAAAMRPFSYTPAAGGKPRHTTAPDGSMFDYQSD